MNFSFKWISISHLILLFSAIFGKLSYSSDSTFRSNPGRVYGVIYSNYHAGLNESKDESGFEIKRAYFGYHKDISKYFSADIKLDIGSPEDLSEYSLIRRYAYFKNALLKYKNNDITVNFGIIDLLYFKIHEQYWAHRYIEKSFGDLYRFGYTADLGAQIIYEWADWLSVDFTISNGEGYTSLQNDNTFKSAFGITLFPGYNFVSRLYYDYSSKNAELSTASAFIGYKIEDKLISGVEYHYRFNDEYTENQDMYGYSVYASWYVFKKWQLFGRFDKVSSNQAEGSEIPWNLANDGSKIISGVEFSPVKQVKLALNYQDWFPYAQNEPNEQFIFLNVEVSF
ncbi:MAG: hypothetical protein JW731_00920 [Bacteroidales bacterium]|nr:hypothetical protein [Bacteroidales bacterium]